MASCVQAKDLQLGDVVRPKGTTMSFGTSVVKQVKDGVITLFRPFVHSGDFSHTGGVSCYIGIEEYQIYTNTNEYELLERKTLR